MKIFTKSATAGLLLIALVLAGACQSERSEPALDTGEPADREYTLKGLIHGYYGVGGEIDGEKNPVLTAAKGETVRIILINGERMPHDIALRAHGKRSAEILAKDEQTTLVFTAESDDTYYCTIPGHVQAGMEGEFQLIGDGESPVATAHIE